MFNGDIPIILDALKQHYFIDRDGPVFRHILNFLRSGKLCLPDNYDEHALLLEEAKFYEIAELVELLNAAAPVHTCARRASRKPNKHNGSVSMETELGHNSAQLSPSPNGVDAALNLSRNALADF